jgi:Fe-Mn family superoxide dismutase
MVKQFKLPELKYSYNELEPFMDKRTLKIHYEKHHQTYCDKFNNEIKELNLKETDLSKIIEKAKKTSQKIVNFGGGYVNHNFFFESLKKDIKPTGKILKLINENFKSFDNFVEKFSNASAVVFGSGWTWLVLDEKTNNLKIISTTNQESPFMSGVCGTLKPLLVIDVWEHAYYLKYQNKRPEFIKNYFNIVNWDIVNKRINRKKLI